MRGHLGDRQWTDDELGDIHAAVIDISKAHNVPFPEVLREEPPKRATSSPRRPAPDEGETMPDEDVEALKGVIYKMRDSSPAQYSWLKSISDAATAAGRPIGVANLPSKRRWSILRALWCCAVADDNDDVLRQMLGAVMGEEVQPSVSLGLAVGSLTIDEAERLARLAQALGSGVAVEVDQYGVPCLMGDLKKAMAA